MSFPNDLKYTKDHEWTKISSDSSSGKVILTVGITDHAQSSLGDIVYLELPPIGKKLNAHETFGVVESIKAVSDLYSPVSGTVIEIHQELTNSPGKINEDPYDQGWLIRLEASNAAEVSALLTPEDYEKHVNHGA